MDSPPLTIALTGGIASGKSAVAERFAVLGAEVIDADVVARELVAPGMPALTEIVAAFGPGVLDAHGALDRRAMREHVFGDEAARRRLEAILHPRVRAALRERAAASRAPYVLLVIPLLVESGHYDWVDRVLVVDAAREVQRARLLARDGVSPELAEAMLDAQASRAQRLALADDVIVNDGHLDALDAQVDALHRRYLELARARTA
ncbi:MAG: dephospho-CoA kinase [Rhodanobacteraceae bacterium]|jgi:dephospho-CoA kinase|nr:dephospho-CoA kinase [Rhodanobacteraceae bacterium]